MLVGRHLLRVADLGQDGEMSENEAAAVLGQGSSVLQRRFADFLTEGRPSRFKRYDVDKGGSLGLQEVHWVVHKFLRHEPHPAWEVP